MTTDVVIGNCCIPLLGPPKARAYTLGSVWTIVVFSVHITKVVISSQYVIVTKMSDIYTFLSCSFFSFLSPLYTIMASL